MILNGKLWRLTAKNARQYPPELSVAIQRSIDELAASKAPKRALKAGDCAPDFLLPDTSGHTIALSDLLRRGLVVLSFYRGGWCPYCTTELRAYQALLPEIRALGAELVAISPQTQHHSLLTAGENGLSFPVLSDPGGRVAERFGLNYAVPGALRKLAERFGQRMTGINGAEDRRLPMPATYVIAWGRCIILAGVHADFRRRLEPVEVLVALRDIAEARGLWQRSAMLRADARSAALAFDGQSPSRPEPDSARAAPALLMS
jgi:peroxiredoxin